MRSAQGRDALLRDPGVRVSTLPLLLQPALASNGNVTLRSHHETCPLTSQPGSRGARPYHAPERVLPCKARPTTLFSAEIFPLRATMHTRWTSVRHRMLS